MDTPEIIKLKNSVTELDHASGPATAPVTLLEYGNFECIHCGRAYPVIKQLQKLLGDSLRFVFRHFPSVHTHPHSMRAAEAAEAAGASPGADRPQGGRRVSAIPRPHRGHTRRGFRRHRDGTAAAPGARR